MSKEFNQFIPYFFAQKKAKKNGVKVPREALLGLMPATNPFLSSFLLTDVATKKAIEKKQKEDANALLSELVNVRATELNGVAAAGVAANALVIATRRFSPALRSLIASRVNVPEVKAELLR